MKPDDRLRDKQAVNFGKDRLIVIERRGNLVGSHESAPDSPMQSVKKTEGVGFKNSFLSSGADLMIHLSRHSEGAVFDPPDHFVPGGMEIAADIGRGRRDEKSQRKKGESQNRKGSFHGANPPFRPTVKVYHMLAIALLIGLLAAGCAAVTKSLGMKRNLVVPPEYRQKVGLYVHDKPERFYYPGSATLDVSDLMAFHLQQTLPFTAQTAFQEIFSDVTIKEPGPQIQFKTPDLAGYFEIKIVNLRYDYPDPGASNYRAEVSLMVEFKTSEEETIWKSLFQGEGIGFSDPNQRLSEFGRGAASALEEAFQNAVYDMQDAVLKAPVLQQYFQWYQAKKTAEASPPPTSAPPTSSESRSAKPVLP